MSRKRSPVPSAPYEPVVEAVPVAMVVADGDGTIVLANAAAERLLGYARSELIGRPIAVLLPERLREGHAANRPAVLSAPQAGALHAVRELVALRKDGTEIPIEIALSSMAADAGVLVLTAIVDLTERQRAEATFRRVVEAAPSAMLLVDATGTIVLTNSQAEKLFGYAREEVVGRPVGMLVPERARAAHAEHRVRFVAAPEARAMGAGRDLHGVRKDGSEVPLEIGLSPVELHDGVHVLSSIIDITARKRAETERESLLPEARAASQAKDDFLATLSHELRTPLHAILGWASMLREGGLSEADSALALETIERNARHQARMVGEVLDVSRIIKGRFQLELGTCDLTSVVASALRSLGPAARAKQIRLRSSIEAIDSIVADAGRIEQIVWNLTSNAIKFTPKGGTVDVELAHAGSHVRLVVRDTGRGIPQRFLPHVFERFTQADTSSTREHGGLGLGLAISRHLVELHGGTISARSDGDGKGATFTVTLPVAPPDEITEELPGEPARAAQEIQAATLDTLRILVVDDDPDTLDLLKHGLERFGAVVASAPSVDEALAVLSDFEADVVVADIAMPNRDGFALVRDVRERLHASRARVPLVALTAYAGSEDRRRALDAGFALHVAKPIEPRQLAHLIARVVRDAAGAVCLH